MLKLRKKVLSAALAAFIAVSAAQIPVWSEEEVTAVSDEAAAEAVTNENGYTVFVTEEEALAKMSLMAENDSLQLYFNEDDYVFAIKNKANGYTWWSAPYNNDPEQNNTYFSKRTTLLSLGVINTDTKSPETLRAHGSNVIKTFEKIENGIRFNFEFLRPDMIVPLEIVLNDGYFTAKVPVAQIKENRPETNAEGDIGYQLLGISVLENFGATDRSHDGMMIVPDGSGAVINYNNNAPAGDVNTYTGTVYGRDLAVSLLEAEDVYERVTMPVVGRITEGEGEDNGLVIIATQGDEYAKIRAAVTGQDTVTDLNTCWFKFGVRTQDKYFMGSANEPLTVFESKGIKTGDIEVAYYLINDSDLSYVDVAEAYRDYIINDIGVTKKTEANTAPFYLTLFGGTVKERSVAGIPVSLQTTATTYSEALEIIQKLEEKGVTNIKFIYEDFNKAGIAGNVADKFQYSSKLGGERNSNSFTTTSRHRDMNYSPAVTLWNSTNPVTVTHSCLTLPSRLQTPMQLRLLLSLHSVFLTLQRTAGQFFLLIISQRCSIISLLPLKKKVQQEFLLTRQVTRSTVTSAVRIPKEEHTTQDLTL